jgi:beta-glucosidase
MKSRTYRYFQGTPLFPFGYGLSYTTFAYSRLNVGRRHITGDSVHVTADVKNTGALAGDEVVQVYVSNKTASVPVPLRSLSGFRRVHLAPGEQAVVEFTLAPDAFSVIDANNERVILPGTFEISVGGGQPNGPARTLTTAITLE